MKLSKELPEKIDVFEYLLPKLKLMTVEPTSKEDVRTPELRFIELLEELSINTTEANRLIQLIDHWGGRVAMEHELMSRRADGFINLYATDYNHYFRDTKNYKNQASKMLTMMCTIYKEFTNTSLIEQYKYYDEEWKRKLHSLFDSSPLNSAQVQNSFYGLETYQPLYQLLFTKLQNLFLQLQKLFEFAQNIDNMVERMRKDHPRIIGIFNACKDKKVDGSLKYLIPALDFSVLKTIFPELVKDLQELTFEEFIVKYYHELNNAEFSYIIPLYEKYLKESFGIEKDEASLYEDVLDIHEKIKRVKKLRVLMDHLDEFDTKGIKVCGKDKYYVSGYFIAMLMEEAAIPYMKGTDFVEKYFPKHYHGEYVPIKFGTVNKKKIDEKSDKYIKFKYTANRLTADSERNTSQINEQKIVKNTDTLAQSSLLNRLFT